MLSVRVIPTLLLRGNGLEVVWPDVLALGGFLLVMFRRDRRAGRDAGEAH